MRPTGFGSGIAVSRQVLLALFYESRLDPAVMREWPGTIGFQTLCQLAERIEAAHAPDVKGARISRSRGRLSSASRAVQHRDRERTLGQDGWGVAEDGSGRWYLAWL